MRAVNSDRSFFALIALAAMGVAFIGFGPSYYLKEVFDSRPLPAMLHVHGAAFSAWLLLFLTQALLIRNGRFQLHRYLGYAGAVIAIVMVTTGMAVVFAKPNATEIARALAFLAIQSLALFAVFVGLAIRYRKDAATHKRLIVIATLFTLPPAIGRLMVMFDFRPFPDYPMLTRYAALVVIGVPLVLHDLRTLGRLHGATALGVAVNVLQHPLYLLVGFTSAWQWLVAAI